MEDVSAALPHSTHAWFQPGTVAMSTSIAASAVCLCPSLSTSVSSPVSVSGHISHGLTTQHQEGGQDVASTDLARGAGPRGHRGLGRGGSHNEPSRSLVPPAPQLQAPLRRFLRQEMVIEVVRSVPLSAHLSLPPCFLHTSAHSFCPLASCSSTPAGALGHVPTLPLPLGMQGSPPPSLGLAVPLGTVGRRVGLWA